MNTQILVPLDGSALAEAVLPQVVTLARSMSGSLTLVRVVPDMVLARPLDGAFPTTPDMWEGYEREPEIAREYLATVAERLRAEKLGVETAVLEGDPARSIVHYAEGHPHVEMIAMSTHARTGLGRLVLGSVSEHVLHATPVPLMLIHPAGGEELPRSVGAASAGTSVHKILVPLDGSAFAEQALDQAKLLAADLGASIVLLTVLSTEYDIVSVEGGAMQERVLGSPDSEAGWAIEYLGEVARRLRLERFVVEVRTAYGDPAEEILKATQKTGADMVVMSTHGRSGLPRLVLGSVAMRVVERSRQPVVLVRYKERVALREPVTVPNGLDLKAF